MADIDLPSAGLGMSRLGVHAQTLLAAVAASERAAARALPSDDPLDPKRVKRVQLTRAEMFAQPEVIARNWATQAETIETLAGAICARRPARVFLVGAGDSLAVMVAVRLALETMTGISCEPVQSLELAVYLEHLVTPDSLVIVLSSSGETTQTVHALLVAQHAGAMTLALTNTPGSTLAREADSTVLIEATRAGWPTQSSTAPLALLLRLAAELGRLREVPGAASFRRELDTLPDLMADTLARADAPIAAAADAEVGGSMYLFSGAGPNLASAIVGAAKVKECTPDHATAVQLEEFHHYNSQKAGEPLWLLVPSGPAVVRAVDSIAEAQRLGGHVHAITSDEEPAFDADARTVLHLPAVSEALSPMLYFLPAQLIGYHLAVAKFARARND